MSIIYTYRWNSQFANEDLAKDEAVLVWFDALRDLSVYNLKRGLDECAKSLNGYVPTPGEFRDRCLPSIQELGIPDIDDAWVIANSEPWKFPVVWHTVNAIGSYVFKHGNQKDIQFKFATTYAKFVQRAREGEKFMIPSNPQLPNPDSRPFKRAEPSVRDREMDKMCKFNPMIRQNYKGK